MKFYFISLLLLFLANQSVEANTPSIIDNEACNVHYAYGKPITNQKTIQLCRIGYSNEYLNSCKAPLLVSEKLLAGDVHGTQPRNRFIRDPSIDKNNRAELSDYFKSGYDKGHMAPASDFSNNSATMYQSFYLSNVVPQIPSLNRGQWKSLETHVKDLAQKRGEIYVYTGVIFGTQKIGNGVCVPDMMYKIIIDKNTNESIAYLIPNSKIVKGYKNYVTSIQEIEKLTGINTIPNNKNIKKDVVNESLYSK
jgi:endonuclease G, mitochondrial